MRKRPVVLVTRKLPEAVEGRLRRDYEPRLNLEDRLYGSDELITLAADADAILPCHTERLTAALIARLPASVRAIANFSVGVDHVDLAAAGLDVYNNEPHINAAFRELPNTLLLPHIGSATRETRDAMGFRALDNLDAIFAGREPRDRVA
jgi:lactate dehydrogenase-like 2-hydroxyacid dehydrogenase